MKNPAVSDGLSDVYIYNNQLNTKMLIMAIQNLLKFFILIF